jgi:alanine racemase
MGFQQNQKQKLAIMLKFDRITKRIGFQQKNKKIRVDAQI